MFQPIIPIIIAKKRRLIVKSFRDTEATSKESGRTLESLNIRNSLIIKIMKLKGVLVEAGEGRLFLDEVREEIVNRQRKFIVAAILIILAGVIIFVDK